MLKSRLNLLIRGGCPPLRSVRSIERNISSWMGSQEGARERKGCKSAGGENFEARSGWAAGDTRTTRECPNGGGDN